MLESKYTKDDLVIKQADELAGAPREVAIIVAEAHLELRKRYDYPISALRGVEHVMWAELPTGEPVGFLVWHKKDKGRIWWCNIAWVRPDLRGLRLYSTLREKWEELGRADPQCVSVESETADWNTSMQKVLHRHGAKIVAYHWRKSVK